MSLSGAQVTRLWPYGGPGFNYGDFTGKAPGAPSDTIPDAFSFSDQAGVALGATITSAAVPITGIDTTVSFTATDGTIDVNEDGNFQTSRDVVNNDTIRARHTSSGSYLTATHTTVTGGGVSDIFTSTTLGDPANTAYLFSPFSFSWWRF